MKFDAVICDLDGTLLDTLADIATAANAALKALSFPEHALDDWRSFVGEGVARLFEKALPADQKTEAVVSRCINEFQRAYAQCWHAQTKVYPGVPELLDGLTSRGLLLAVLSNKPDPFTQSCVGHFLARWSFAAVAGQRPDVPRKPDPAGALTICRQLGVAAGRTLYLGDSAIDMQTATRATMYPVGAAWGFRSVDELISSGAAAIANAPSDVLGLVNSQPGAS
jgi:phosphoglycolate phosphatase